MRESERKTYTVVWGAVTIVAGLLLAKLGGVVPALVLLVVAGGGLIAFLRVTHPGGDTKPPLAIFFDEDGAAGSGDAPVAVATPDAAPAIDLTDGESDTGDARHDTIDVRSPPAEAGTLAPRTAARSASGATAAFASAPIDVELPAQHDAALTQIRSSSADLGDRQLELLERIRTELSNYD